MLTCVAALLSCLPWDPATGSATTGALRVASRIERAQEVVATVVAAEPAGPALLLVGPAGPAVTRAGLPFAGGSGTPAPTPEQVLTTTVQDKAHPGEPWVVTTYRRADESFEAFIKRHREMVEAVREALGG